MSRPRAVAVIKINESAAVLHPSVRVLFEYCTHNDSVVRLTVEATLSVLLLPQSSKMPKIKCSSRN